MDEPPEGSSDERAPAGHEPWLGSARGLQGSLRRAGPVAAASYSLIGGILLLGGLGYAADAWLGTAPWLLVGGLLLGIVVGFYEIARVAWRRTP